MATLAIFFILSLIALWLVLMYGVWKRNSQESSTIGILDVLTPTYKKSTRLVRRAWFTILRWLKYLRDIFEKSITKLFFTLFPNAKSAFEKKDELTGLEHGPSSYFLMSVSEYKSEVQKEEPKKIRRNKKNV